MLQTLFHIPADIAGWPVFGPGLLLGLWAIASVVILLRLAHRQGWNSDTWSYVPILLLVGAIIRWMLPMLCDAEGLPIRGFGMMNMLAVVTGTVLAAWRAKRAGLDPDLMFSLIFWMLVPGILGARAFHVVHFWTDDFAPIYREPGGGFWPLMASIVNIPGGGLVVFGAFFGAMLGLLAFVRKHRLPLLAVCDLIAPSMALGLAIGRVGCLLNGCCFGAVCDHPWAITFPAGTPPEYSFAYHAQIGRGQMHGLALSANPKMPPRIESVRPGSPAEKAGAKSGDVIKKIGGLPITITADASAAIFKAFELRRPLAVETADGRTLEIPAIEPPARSLPVHPTQIYSVIDGLLLCLVLLLFSRFHPRDGAVFALLLSIYPVTRYCIESLRADEAPVFGTGLSIAQNVSVVLLVCAAALWVYIWRRPSRHNA
jgi:phosphatidylglycerol---prolipoprotein diacylglyceryl transferase